MIFIYHVTSRYYIAGTLVISYNIPQLIKMIKTKSTDDVALLSLIFK